MKTPRTNFYGTEYLEDNYLGTPGRALTRRRGGRAGFALSEVRFERRLLGRGRRSEEPSMDTSSRHGSRHGKASGDGEAAVVQEPPFRIQAFAADFLRLHRELHRIGGAGLPRASGRTQEGAFTSLSTLWMTFSSWETVGSPQSMACKPSRLSLKSWEPGTPLGSP